MFSFDTQKIFIEKTNQIVNGSVCYQIESPIKEAKAIVASRLPNGTYYHDKLLFNHEIEFYYLNDENDIIQNQSVFLSCEDELVSEQEYPIRFFVFQKKVYLPKRSLMKSFLTVPSSHFRKKHENVLLCT